MEDVLKPPTIRRHTSLQLFLTPDRSRTRRRRRHFRHQPYRRRIFPCAALPTSLLSSQVGISSTSFPAVVNTCGSHLLLRNGFTTRSSGQDVARIHHQLWSGDRGEHHNTHQNKATAGPVLIDFLVHPRQTLPGILHKPARCEHSVPVPQAEPIALQAVVARASRSYCRRPQGAPSRLL